MNPQQLPAATPTYRSSSMDGFLMRFAWMIFLVKWVSSRKHDSRRTVRSVACNMANVITAVRVVLAYPVSWLMAAALIWLHTHHGLVNVAVVCLCMAALIGLFFTDAVDGTLSNHSGTKSRIGEVADPFADKLLIGCTVYFLVFAASQILPRQILVVMVPVVVLVVALDIVSAVITIGEDLRARLIQALPAKTEHWGKRKMLTQCLGAGLLLVGLALVAAGATTTGLVVVWVAVLILSLSVILATLSVFYHWRNLAGQKLSHVLIALAAPAMGAVSGAALYRWLQEGSQAPSLSHAALGAGLCSLMFLAALTLFYLPQAKKVT